MTITVTPTVDLVSVPPRVQLNVTASAGETSTTITRLDPDGILRTVRTSDGAPLPISGGVALVYDYEAPYGAPVQFSSLESPATVSVQVSVDVADVWLIHPGLPALSQPVSVASLDSRTRRVQRGVFYPMGRKYPVVQTDGQRKAAESVIELRLDSLEELNSIEALVDDAGVLLLNVPASLGWGIDTCYISVGDIEESRLIDYAADEHRYYAMPYQVVAAPVGGTQADRTFADITTTFATFADVQAAYPTFLDLLAGP